MMRKKQSGFTLLELMVVVAIIGILAAVAVPSFIRYMYKARTSEAVQHLEKISAGARSYFIDRHVAKGMSGMVLPQQFPDAIGMTPAVPCCLQPQKKCIPTLSDWLGNSWAELKFALQDPHYFRYEFFSAGVSTDSEFTAVAYGDLDCDGIFSTFGTGGEVMSGVGNLSDMTGQGGFWKVKPLE